MTTLTNQWQQVAQSDSWNGVEQIKVFARAEENVDGNYSTVYTLFRVSIISGHTLSVSNWSAALDNGSNSGGYTTFTNDTDLVLCSWTVGHNADGTCTTSIGASWNATFGITSWGWRDNVTLQTIPRASQPSFPNGSNLTAGSTTQINMNRASSSFTHNISWAFGSRSGQTSGFSSSSGITDSVSWTPPIDMIQQLGVSDQNGSGTITVDTYSGGTHIGTKTLGFNLSVPNEGPDFTNITFEEVGTDGNGKTLSSDGISAITVLGQKSNKKITVAATAKYYANLVSISVTQGTDTRSSSGSSSSLSTIYNFTNFVNDGSNVVFTIKATDSRGRTSTTTRTLSFINYIVPVISGIDVSRETNTSSVGHISLVGLFYNGTIGNINNTSGLVVTYAVQTDNDTGVVTHTVSPTLNGNSWSKSAVANEITGIDSQKSYAFTIKAKDGFGFYSTFGYTLAKATVTLGIGKNTVKIFEHLMLGSKTLENWILDRVFPVGSVAIFSEYSYSPANIFGGSWTRINTGYLYSENWNAGQTSFGSWTTGSTAITVDQMPSHTHVMAKGYYSTVVGSGDRWCVTADKNYPDDTAPNDKIPYVGGNQGHTHSIQPPTQRVYAWKRVS